MFSNRHYRLKLAGALVVVALLGVHAAREGDAINPALWRCVVEPDRWQGRTLWIPAAVIVSARDHDFEIVSSDARIRVDGRAPGKIGDTVALTGVFRPDGPRLELLRARVLPPHHRFRWLLEAVSVIVVLGVLANFARHFLVRPRVLQVQQGNE